MVGRFLAGVGALVWNPRDNTYLLLKRATTKDFGANNWECVTGRVDQGESFETALHREVREEIGVEITIEFIIGTTHFYRGEATPENEMVGIVYCCSTPTPDAVRMSEEHSELRWVDGATALQMTNYTDTGTRWLHKVIRRAELMRQYLPDALLPIFRTDGFETND